MSDIRLVSVSGGKDSTATLLLALETNWLDDVRAVFADTGNEHEATLEYVDYLEHVTGIHIARVKADFTKQMAAKREKLLRIAAGEPESAIYGKREFKWPWTPQAAADAARYLEPTGNPYLDLCLLRGGFPSRTKQYCTEELKALPMERFTAGLLDKHDHIESWQGVRADESSKRAHYPDHEWGPRISIRRPILRWGVVRVFEQHRRHGIKPNPLYSQGMGRVGCMPCINAGKRELAEIAARFPAHIERIAEWEFMVTRTARPGCASTFFHSRDWGHGIDSAVRRSRTKRGGDPNQDDAFYETAPEMCSSMYGLCE